MVVESIFLVPVKAMLNALTSKAMASALAAMKKPKPEEDALRLALALAVRKYSTSNNSQVIARPLLGRKSILRQDDVAQQFAAALVEKFEPDAELVGNRWRERVPNPPLGCDFTKEAQILIGYFMNQRLWVSDVLERRELDVLERMSADIGSIAHQADAVENELAHLLEMLENGFGIASVRGVNHLRFDQTAYIEEHTRGFVGRRAILGEISHAMRTRTSGGGIVFVLADPGIGKTAVMAKLAAERNWVHHFNRRLGGGPTRKQQLLGNVCAQLIARYGLSQDTHAWLSDATEDVQVLQRLIKMVRTTEGQVPVIVIDALDEMESKGGEVTFMHSLSSLATFVVSARPNLFNDLPEELRGTSANQYRLEIDPNSKENRQDIREYIHGFLANAGIARYMRSHNLSAAAFEDELDMRSEGNFMYLRHVLPAIAGGRLRDRGFRELPSGLDGYYADHLAQMSQDSSAWFDYQIAVIVQLATMPQPLALGQIAQQANVPFEKVMQSVKAWGAFLKPQQVRFADGRERTVFSIYHSSFQEYLAKDPYVRSYMEQATDRLRQYGDERYGP